MLKLAIYQWGVDSARNVTEDLYQCVLAYFGFPKFWGRYLIRVAGVSEGLTQQEILFIRSKGIKLLPIYNAFQEAKGYGQGRLAANEAISNAQSLGIPIGVPIFANVERFFQIDSDWIHGWTEEVVSNQYVSGFYNDPVTGGFSTAFCNAAKENYLIKLSNILWSAEPELFPSGPLNTPIYNPKYPDCGGNVWAWQYLMLSQELYL